MTSKDLEAVEVLLEQYGAKPVPEADLTHVASVCFGASPVDGDYRDYGVEQHADGSLTLWLHTRDEWTEAFDEWSEKINALQESDEEAEEPPQPLLYSLQARLDSAHKYSDLKAAVTAMLTACWIGEGPAYDRDLSGLSVDQAGLLSEADLLSIRDEALEAD
jgi:hypothetical protein